MVISNMLRNYNFYFRQLNFIFEKELGNVKKIVDKHTFYCCMPDLYNKWCYCAIQKDCLITPANIFMALSGDSNLFPAIKNFSDKSIEIEPRYYSLENHPIVNDIKIMIENFVPIYDLQLGFDIADDNVKYILSKISMYEPNYLEYLEIICYRLNIFEMMPSLYCERLTLSKNADQFLNKTNQQIFDLVFETTLSIFYENICQLFSIRPYDNDFKFIMELFNANDRSMKKIMLHILNHFDINKASFIEIDEHDYFKDCLYYLNMVVNRFFFLPLGHYLKLIMPVYNHPFNIKLVLALVEKYLEQNQNIYRVFDYADTKFILTELGKNYFGLEQADVFNISEDEVKYLINDFGKVEQKNYPLADRLVYLKLKLEVENNPQYWQVIDCSANITLHDLFLIICKEFNLKNNSCYSFINKVDESEKYNLGSSDDISLNKLHLADKDSFFLILHNQFNRFARESKVVENCIRIKIYVHSRLCDIDNIFFDYRVLQKSKAFS